jgi:hypothetical protein
MPANPVDVLLITVTVMVQSSTPEVALTVLVAVMVTWPVVLVVPMTLCV